MSYYAVASNAAKFRRMRGIMLGPATTRPSRGPRRLGGLRMSSLADGGLLPGEEPGRGGDRRFFGSMQRSVGVVLAAGAGDAGRPAVCEAAPFARTTLAAVAQAPPAGASAKPAHDRKETMKRKRWRQKELMRLVSSG